MLQAYVFSGLLLLVGSNNVKYWLHSNSWSNPSNWDFLPTPCDAVTLPDIGHDYSVLVSGKVQLNSLELPSTGEIVFGERASIAMSARGQCLSPVTNTYRTEQYNWGDPNNWRSATTLGGFGSGTAPSPVFQQADSDKIPCWTDTVVFNESSVYSALVDNSLEVGAFYVGDESLSSEELQHYTEVGSGRSQLQFINLAEIAVTGRTVCTNPEGCLCGNELDCSLVQCPPQNCAKPIQSKGVCCHYCGAAVRFRPPAGFYLLKFKETLAGYLTDTNLINDQVSLTVSLQEYESRINIQITVSDSITGSYDGAGYKSSKIALEIRDYLVKYDTVPDSDIQTESSQPSSGTGTTTETIKEGSQRIESWILYVVLSVSVLMLVVIIVLLFKCSRRYRDNSANQHIRLDAGALPRSVERRFKPCVPALDQDIPTYEEVLMEDMLTRGIAPDQPRSTARDGAAARVREAGPARGTRGTRGYAEIPTSDISEHSRV